ncbi:hypothetical protein KBC89_01590 [Candidatus Woesebacteria bacterium]|nr:hypothetical protein [Candidatus Woesebacteria bacterium]
MKLLGDWRVRPLFVLLGMIVPFLLMSNFLAHAAEPEYDLTNLDTVNYRIDGPTSDEVFPFERGYDLADLDDDGNLDLVGGTWASNNGANSGSVYVVYNVFSRFSNKVLDLSNTDNYDLRIDGAAAYEELPDGEIVIADIDNDAALDVIISTGWADHNGSDSGSVYVIKNQLFRSLTGIGPSKSLNLSDTSNFSFRIDGSAGKIFGYAVVEVVDLNGNNQADLVVSSGWGGNEFYIFYDSLLTTFTGANKIVNIGTSTNYNQRFYDSGGGRFSARALVIVDLNNDGNLDIVVSRYGVLYVIYNDILINTDDALGTLYNMTDSSSFSFSLSEESIGSLTPGVFSIGIGKLDDDDLNDLVIGAPYADYNDRVDSGSLYILYDEEFTALSGSQTLAGNYSVRLDGVAAGDRLGWNSYPMIFDFDADSQNDLLFFSPWADNGSILDSGVAYLMKNSNLIALGKTGVATDLTSIQSETIRFIESASNYLNSRTYPQIRDLNQDSKPDFIFASMYADNNGTDNGSIYMIYNFPHSITATASRLSTDSNYEIAGVVTATESVTSIMGVEFSASNDPLGEWNVCDPSDGNFDSSTENFTCGTGVSDNLSHTYYVRAYDANRSYTAVNQYALVTISAESTSSSDTVPPAKEYSVRAEDGRIYTKTFEQINLSNLSVIGDTHYPNFCFTKSYDTGSGVASYAVIVDGADYIGGIPYTQPPAGDNGDTRKEGESIVKENDRWYLTYHLYDDVSKQQEICVRGKGDARYLDTGLHTWSVKAIDNANNSRSTDTRKFLVMTNQGTYSPRLSNYWFPLVLRQIGNRTNLMQYSSITPELFTLLTKPLSFSDSTPTFYGIAPVGSTIELSLYQDINDAIGGVERKQVVSSQTQTNESSEWGINVTSPLAIGSYYVTVQAEDASNHFAVLKDIPIKLVGAATSQASSAAVLGISTTATPTPTSTSINLTMTDVEKTLNPTLGPFRQATPITTTPTCIFKWCW